MVGLNFHKQLLGVITGTSRGIGRAIALEVQSRLKKNSRLVMINKPQLATGKPTYIKPNLDESITVDTVHFDLSKPDVKEFRAIFDKSYSNVTLRDYEFAVIIHNAASIGPLQKADTLSDLREWKKYYELNLYSPILLNNEFLAKTKPHVRHIFVVHMMSICGLVPHLNMAMYGSVKAARFMYFTVLALEEPNIQVMNFSPGPVQTDMFATAIKESDKKDELHAAGKIVDTKSDHTTVLTPEETARKLLDVLESGSFRSGAFVDYFGRMPKIN